VFEYCDSLLHIQYLYYGVSDFMASSRAEDNNSLGYLLPKNDSNVDVSWSFMYNTTNACILAHLGNLNTPYYNYTIYGHAIFHSFHSLAMLSQCVLINYDQPLLEAGVACPFLFSDRVVPHQINFRIKRVCRACDDIK